MTRDILTDRVHDKSCDSLTFDSTDPEYRRIAAVLVGTSCTRDEVVAQILDRLPGATVIDYPRVESRLLLWSGD